MNSEFLLEAIGLIDDELIADAERRPERKPIPLPKILGWAACLAVVIVLGYGASHLDIGMGGGNSAAPAASSPAASAPAASTPAAGAPMPGGIGVPGIGGGNAPAAAPEPQTPEAGEPSASAGGSTPQDGNPNEVPRAIRVDGMVYWSTGAPVPLEPEPSEVRTSDTYAGGTPEEDGQNNFSQEPVQYVKTDMGLVVLMDEEWVLFTPFPPEE